MTDQDADPTSQVDQSFAAQLASKAWQESDPPLHDVDVKFLKELAAIYNDPENLYADAERHQRFNAIASRLESLASENLLLAARVKELESHNAMRIELNER